MSIKDLKMTGNDSVVDNHLPENREYQLTVRYNEMRLLETLITSDMRKLATTLGTDFTGLEHSVKTASSVEDKLKRSEKELGSNFKEMNALSEFKDIIRYTEICNHDDIMRVAKHTIENLQERGYILSGIRNYYLNPYPDTGYQGLHLNFITPYGQEIELQVHSEESFAVKEKAHYLYEKIRQVGSFKEDKELLKEKINQIHSSIAKPFGYEEFPFKYDLSEKKEIMDALKCNVDVYIVESTFYEKPYALSYSVELNDEQLLCGFENVYTDGSARVYRNNIRDGVAIYSSLDKNGVEISTRSATQKEITLEKALEIANKAEELHVEWMSKNFSGKNREDLNINIEESIERTAPTVSSMEIDGPELF